MPRKLKLKRTPTPNLRPLRSSVTARRRCFSSTRLCYRLSIRPHWQMQLHLPLCANERKPKKRLQPPEKQETMGCGHSNVQRSSSPLCFYNSLGAFRQCLYTCVLSVALDVLVRCVFVLQSKRIDSCPSTVGPYFKTICIASAPQTLWDLIKLVHTGHQYKLRSSTVHPSANERHNSICPLSRQHFASEVQSIYQGQQPLTAA